MGDLLKKRKLKLEGNNQKMEFLVKTWKNQI